MKEWQEKSPETAQGNFWKCLKASKGKQNTFTLTKEEKLLNVFCTYFPWKVTSWARWQRFCSRQDVNLPAF